MVDRAGSAVRYARDETPASRAEHGNPAPRPYIVAAIGLAVLALLVPLGWLGRLERGGPAHVDIELPGGIPATFYFQGLWSPFGLPAKPPPHGNRPPGIALCHGFSADRTMMSTLARRLASNGYAVLAIDARGHGENRHPFDGGGDGSGLSHELTTAVAYLRASPHVDGARIAVMGHSMGAGASLEYATRDPELTAAVMISGGFRTDGPHRPPNALFIYAQHDPANLQQASDAVAARLAEVGAGNDPAAFAARRAVRVVSVPGHDHLTILWSSEAAGAIVGWLDSSFAMSRGTPPNLEEPRLRAAAMAFAAFLLMLPGIGWLVGRLAPAATAGNAHRLAARLGALALVLVAMLPLNASHVMTAPLAVPVAQEVVSFFLMSGVALLAGLALFGDLRVRELARGCGQAVAAAAVGGIAIAATFTPLGIVAHRLALTPERAVIAVAMTLALLPLYLALELLLRRGSTLVAAAAASIGRLLVLAVLYLGVAAGILPWVIDIMLPVVVSIFLLGEILAWPIYAISGNRLSIAFLQAGWFAWLISATMATRV